MSRTSWIDINPEIMGGKPCIRDTRVPVETIMTMASEGYTVEVILAEFPFLNETDLVYAKTYADMIKGSDVSAVKDP